MACQTYDDMMEASGRKNQAEKARAVGLLPSSVDGSSLSQKKNY